MEGFKIGKRNYYDGKGNEVSEEQFNQEYSNFEQDRKTKYDSIVDTIMSQISQSLSEEQKLELLFSYFVSHINYDYQVLDIPNSNGLVSAVYYPFESWGNWKISSSEKYGPIILGIGICAGISEAFEDISKKMGIYCRIINGNTRVINESNGARLGHCWNVLDTPQGEKHIDVTYGIFNRDKKQNSLDFFNITTEQLKLIGPHCNFDESFGKSR